MGERIQALGMIEFTSIAVGITAADAMVKAASVELLMAKTICPGKFLVGVHAEVGAVRASLEAGLAQGRGAVADQFLIPNLNPPVIAALACGLESPTGPALGVIETYSASASILAADAASKAAEVEVAEVRLAMGLGGKAFCLLTGEVAAVETAVAAGSALAAEEGMLVRKTVIPRVAPQLMRQLL